MSLRRRIMMLTEMEEEDVIQGSFVIDTECSEFTFDVGQKVTNAIVSESVIEAKAKRTSQWLSTDALSAVGYYGSDTAASPLMVQLTAGLATGYLNCNGSQITIKQTTDRPIYPGTFNYIAW